MERISGIYVPGLGDDQARGQDQAARDFARHGIDFAYHPVQWNDKELWQPKQDRLNEQIDELYEKSGPVVLMGSSAGASAILNAGTVHPEKVAGFVVICGKILHPESLTGKDFDENPAFRESLEMLPKSVASLRRTHKDRVLSLRPLWDGRVPVADTKIGYGQEIVMPMIGHVASIATGLIFYKKPIARFSHEAYSLAA